MPKVQQQLQAQHCVFISNRESCMETQLHVKPVAAAHVMLPKLLREQAPDGCYPEGVFSLLIIGQPYCRSDRRWPWLPASLGLSASA